MKNEISEKIINILKNLNINTDNLTSNFIEENNIDSITFIQMILDIELEFSVLIPDEYLLMEDLNTIYDIIEMVEQLLNMNNLE